MPKTLVVCCDGTWKRADEKDVSNVEKIARSIQLRDPRGEPQIVHYSKGVGATGIWLERLLAGALGLGLDDAISDCYRFLALNFEPGDRVFVFGFSRGAYTARSLCGMIDHVGLLTPAGVAGNQLGKANTLYRTRPQAKDRRRQPPEVPEHTEALGELTVHPADAVAIDFLGVFDTVGALGIPGFSGSKYKFHNVSLSPMVRSARQALALADRRRVFAPCLWGGWHRDLVQVWFDGVHTDVGGGYDDCFYSDKSLFWMAQEAAGAGQYGDRARLAIDFERLGAHRNTGSCKTGNDNPMNAGYRLTNLVDRIQQRMRRRRMWDPFMSLFRIGWRTLNPTVVTPPLSAAQRALLPPTDIPPSVGPGYPYNVHIETSAYARAVRSEPNTNPNVAQWFDWVETLLADTPPAERQGLLDKLCIRAPTFAELTSADVTRPTDSDHQPA